MLVNGTIINYYFHCKRQCWLHGNRVNMEDNSENVKIGKAIHEAKAQDKDNTEISIDNIKIDKITKDYLVEIKKSDADVEAVKWQTLYYLKKLKEKGINKKGKIEFVEKNKGNNKIIYVELDEEKEKNLENIVTSIETMINGEYPSEGLNKPKCKKCAYFEYCYI